MDESRLLRVGLRAAHAIVNEEPFTAELAEGLRRVVGVDCVCVDVCREWPVEIPSVTLAGEPGFVPAGELDRWMRLSVDDDPYVLNLFATRDPRPYRTTDFMTFTRFRQTAVYREVLAAYGMRYLLVMAPRITEREVVLVGLTRRLHDFSDIETRALYPVREMIARALDYQSTVRGIRAALDSAAPAGCNRRGLTLTERENQVLALVAAGHTNDQAARRLGISTRTVRKHLESVFSKVDVASRTAAVAWWLGRGNA